jgi:hypothetical protein
MEWMYGVSVHVLSYGINKAISNPLAPLCLACVFAFFNPTSVVFIRLGTFALTATSSRLMFFGTRKIVCAYSVILEMTLVS